MEKKTRVGVVLIVIGILGVISQFIHIDDNLFLGIIGLGFIMAYVVRGGRKSYSNVGFLIPACVLLALQAYVILEEHNMLQDREGAAFFLFMSIAFLAIYLIHTVWFKMAVKSERNWPLITSGAILAFATVVYLAEARDSYFVRIILRNFWSIGLIIVGIVFVIKSFRNKQ